MTADKFGTIELSADLGPEKRNQYEPLIFIVSIETANHNSFDECFLTFIISIRLASKSEPVTFIISNKF